MGKRLSELGVGHAYAPVEQASEWEPTFLERTYVWVLSLSETEQALLCVAAATLVLMAVVVIGNYTTYRFEKAPDQDEQSVSLSDRAELDQAIRRMRAGR